MKNKLQLKNVDCAVTSMIQKKILYLLLLIAFTLSCKKGDNDPILFLKTRKSRLEGDWKLMSGHMKLKFEKDGAALYEETYSITENSFTSINTADGSSLEGKYKLQLSFTKDGDFSFLQLIGSNNISGNGTWDFLRKSNNYKSKERISFKPSAIGGGSYWIDAFNKSANYFSYDISELRSNKLVLKGDEELLDVYGKDGVTCYITSLYAFTQ